MRGRTLAVKDACPNAKRKSRPRRQKECGLRQSALREPLFFRQKNTRGKCTRQDDQRRGGFLSVTGFFQGVTMLGPPQLLCRMLTLLALASSREDRKLQRHNRTSALRAPRRWGYVLLSPRCYQIARLARRSCSSRSISVSLSLGLSLVPPLSRRLASKRAAELQGSKSVETCAEA